MTFCGAPGSGKTSLFLGLLTSKGDSRVYRGVYDHIFLFMLVASRASLKDEPFKEHDARKTFDELDIEHLTSVYDMILKFSEKKQHSLIIFDDVTSDLKDVQVQKLLNRIVQNRRHLKCSIQLLVQSYIAIPLTTRKLITHLILFRPNNKKELESLASEILFIDKNTLQAIMKFVYKEAHDFMFVDVAMQKYFRRFNPLTF
jgi:hypothetical protein